MHYRRFLNHGNPDIVKEPFKGCIIEGCTNEHRSNKLCQKHYDRYKRGKNLQQIREMDLICKFKNIEEKFLTLFEPVTESGCWVWLGAINNSGYGSFSFDGKTYLAHRYAYERFKNIIPENMMVLHSCDVRVCCNPNHLFIGTCQDNTNDKLNKGRQLRGSKVGTAKLTENQIKQIRASKKNLMDIANNFNVTPSNIGYIKAGKTWKHVT